MTKMQNVCISGSVIVPLLTLTLPLSAGAFSRSPGPSEVFNQPGQMASPASLTGADGGGALFGTVPEPSSLLFLGIALGIGALVAIWKWTRQTTEQ